MQPDINKITIDKNKERIQEFIKELIVAPQQILEKWSKITNQTPATKIGYIGQHLASLITGIPGTGTGARGDDLSDGSEVKSCNKVDQVDTCNECGHRVMRYQKRCPNPECNSTDINRKNDSKWLFTIRSEKELKQYINMNRVVLILMDYPEFTKHNYNDIRISCFEIYPNEKRMQVFNDLITNYYYNIYKPKVDRRKKTNPMNLHPFSFQFYKCNPIQTFECTIKDIDGKAKITIGNYIEPQNNRDEKIETLPMPSSLLKSKEWDVLLDKSDFDYEIKTELKQHTDITKQDFIKLTKEEKEKSLPFLNENLRNKIPLREIISTEQKKQYTRS